jgi:selenide,water dikinase
MGPRIPRNLQDLLFDPQTSGGLLISVPRERGEILQAALREYGVKETEVIGEIVGEPREKVVVV